MTNFLINYGEITLRSLTSIFLLFFLAKLIGPRQIAQLTFYDYVIGISVGSIAASVAVDKDISIGTGLWAMLLYVLVSLAMAWSGNKSIWARRFFSGTPKILYAKGKIIERNLKKQNLDLNDLLGACRTNGYFQLDTLDYIIMEINGSLSFLPKSDNTPLTPKDMSISTTSAALSANVVIDGNIMEHHLAAINKDIPWLMGKITGTGHSSARDFLLVTATEEGRIFFYPKNQTEEKGDCFD